MIGLAHEGEQEAREPLTPSVADVAGSKITLTEAERQALVDELRVEGRMVHDYAAKRTASIARRNEIMETLYVQGGMSQVALAEYAQMTKGMAQQILAGPAEQARLSQKRADRAKRARKKANGVGVPVKASARK